ncbi:L,D-transpeptidase [Gammaproteobacteria bacterium]
MSQPLVLVSIAEQRLRLITGSRIVMDVAVSTARKGVGERRGSEQTPRGWHQIRACIGANRPPNTVFVGRRPTGEVYSPALRASHPQRDWILTRILWLSGLEIGRNRLSEVDTMARYIYIHGCPEESPMGIPGSHGCIRMRNDEIIELFQQVQAGTRVNITEAPTTE